MTAPINNNFFADPKALAPLKNEAKAQDQAALKKVAQQFESLFTQQLLKSMRASNETMGDSLFGSNQQDFYQDMFDDQLLTSLSQGKGLGLADMLVQQLSQSRLTQPLNTALTPGEKDAAPISLTPAVSKDFAALPAARTVFPAVMQPKAAPVVTTSVPTTSATTPSATAAPTTSAAPIASKHDFVKQMLPHAQAAARELGVDPHALLAQAALETGWGKSMPRNADGSSSFNMFGIKAGKSWPGATTNVPTLEFEEGVAVRKVEKFRAYDSPADSFRDYANVIGRNNRYEKAVGKGSDVAGFAQELQKGGYATDPAYAEKVTKVADEVRGISGDGRKRDIARLAAM